jgi:hypothetical protein
MNCWPSETCPLQLQNATQVPCRCHDDCLPEHDCSLEHHALRAGATKTAVTGLFGLNSTLQQVAARLPADVRSVVTLVIPLDSDADTYEEEKNEVDTNKFITQNIDPMGLFTARYIWHEFKFDRDNVYKLPPWFEPSMTLKHAECKEYRDIQNQVALQQVANTTQDFQAKILALLAKFPMSYAVMYMEDAGVPLHTMHVHTEHQAVMLQAAMHDLLQHYATLARYKRANMDLHQNNLTWQYTDQSHAAVRVRMIDFGWNSNDGSDVILSFVSCHMQRTRYWWPVHYYFFDMAVRAANSRCRPGQAIPAWKDIRDAVLAQKAKMQDIHKKFGHLFSYVQIFDMLEVCCEKTVAILYVIRHTAAEPRAKMARGVAASHRPQREWDTEYRMALKEFQKEVYGSDDEDLYRRKFDEFSIASNLFRMLYEKRERYPVFFDSMQKKWQHVYVEPTLLAQR